MVDSGDSRLHGASTEEKQGEILSELENISSILGSGSPSLIKNIYNEVSSVGSATETTIVSHTAVIGKSTYILRGDSSGTNIAEYKFYVNSTIIDKKHTYFGGDLNASFYFSSPQGNNPGLLVNVGDIITVKVIHNRTSPGDFSSKILLMEIG